MFPADFFHTVFLMVKCSSHLVLPIVICNQTQKFDMARHGLNKDARCINKRTRFWILLRHLGGSGTGRQEHPQVLGYISISFVHLGFTCILFYLSLWQSAVWIPTYFMQVQPDNNLPHALFVRLSTPGLGFTSEHYYKTITDAYISTIWKHEWLMNETFIHWEIGDGG